MVKMNIKKALTVCLMIFAALVQSMVFAGEIKAIKLPAPQTNGGKPLMQALGARQSQRAFSPEELSPQTISDLLWAANGVNRPDGRRTAPTAGNKQEIDVYAAKKEGLYLYDAVKNELVPILGGDIRSVAGKQDFVKVAPMILIYAADLSKMTGWSEEDTALYSATDTGYISQNVYLYCASEGLSTVVLGWVDKEDLAKAMKLRPDQRVMLTQPVGYPKK